MRLLLYISLFSFIACSDPNDGDDFSDPHDWHYNPGLWEFTAWMTASVSNEGSHIGDDGDILAAFDDAGTVRGVAVQVTPLDQNGEPFGPFAGKILYEMTIGSNGNGDNISFQYYDASADTVLGIVENYTFKTNELQGDLVSPVFYNIVQISTE